MRISEKYQDIAKKWRVRVTLDDGNSIFLKFQEEPKDEEVFKRAEEQTKVKPTTITEEEEKLSLIKDIPLTELKSKLGVISGTTK